MMHSTGPLICLASAVAFAFGAMAILGKLVYDEGVTVGTLLTVRFLLAAVLFWALAAVTGVARRLRTLSRRDIAIALALGGLGYSAQAGAYFAALQRLDAALLSLLLYTFPAMVTLAAIALGRERANRRTAGALLLASAGLTLVLAEPLTTVVLAFLVFGETLGSVQLAGAALVLAAVLVLSAPARASEPRAHQGAAIAAGATA